MPVAVPAPTPQPGDAVGDGSAVATSVRPPAIDVDRLLGRLDALGRIGDTGDGGCCRLALSDADAAGRAHVGGLLRDLGLRVASDGLGNTVAVRPGREDGPPVLIGSHIDTVRTGGRYDGNLGVLAGVEVLTALEESGTTTRSPVGVAFFTNEEGARFAPDMMGSLVFVGGMDLDQARSVQGIDGPTVGQELDRLGLGGDAPVPFPAPRAFLELHIEQGPVLEGLGVQIGAVTGTQAISWQELVFHGVSNHAGTTPMAMRRDAAYAAAELTTFVRRLALELGGHQVGTVGSSDLYPNLVNVVAGRAACRVDLRNTDDDVLAEAEGRLVAFVAELCRAEGVTVAARTLARFDAVSFDPAVVDLVEATAVRCGYSCARLPSGAGHDAQMLARVCPAGMIFVPSSGGISHNPAEHTDPALLGAGADVLLHAVLDLAG